MKTPILLLTSLMLISWGCQRDQREAPTTGERPMAEPAEESPEFAAEREGAAGAASLQLSEQQPYGQFITNADGMPLYMFEADQRGQSSTCYDACAEAWPPVLADGDPKAAAPDLKEDLLGTITRKDGSKQVTYGGWPLYTYAKDSRGEVTGQDVHGFGGGWYLMSPDGSKITDTKNE